MRYPISITLLALSSTFFTVPAAAQTTIECRSRDYQYSECPASGLSRPQLIHQISSASCILNRTWGFNPRSGNLWVSQGYSGTFADVSGYHHGRGDTYDDNARRFDDRGRDSGAMIGGLLVGALLVEAASSEHHHKKKNEDSYDGCHGSGCLVDNPDLATPDSPPEPGQIDMR